MPGIQSYSITLAGTPSENGRALGGFVHNDEELHRHFTDRIAWFDAYDKSAVDFEAARACREIAARRMPSYFAEVEGFAAALGIPYEEYLPYLMYDWDVQSHCSQFCVLPGMTRGGKVYSGHSWEWTMEEEKNGRLQTLEEDNLFIVRKNPAASFMGFALNYAGLWNGLNAHGVSVNPTGGVPVKTPDPGKQLFNHGLLVRCILETCRSADEALEVYDEFAPLTRGGGGGTLMIADGTGKAYYIERMEGTSERIAVGKGGGKKYQCAANHFVIPAMVPRMNQKGIHSILRYNALSAWMEARANDVTMESLTDMQSRLLPDGPCCHHYQAYLGTVRSMVFDLTDRRARVSFGSPRLNPWRDFGFDVRETAMTTIPTAYVDEEADPEIWRHIPPDEEYPPR